MAPRKGDEYVKLGVETDEQSFAQYEARLNATIQKANALQMKLGQAYVEGNAAAQKAKSSFDVATQSLDKSSKAAKQLKQDLKDAGDEAEVAQKKSSGIGLGTAARLGAGTIKLGQNIAQGDIPGILTDVARLKGEFQQVAQELTAGGATVAESFGAVAAAAAPLAVVLGPIAIGFGVLYAEVKKGQAQIESAQKGVEAYYTAIATGSKSSIDEQIKALEVQKGIQEKIRDVNQGALDQFYKDSLNASNVFESAAHDFVDLTGGLNPVRDKISAANKQIEEFNVVLAALKEASKDATISQQEYVDEIEAGIKAANEAADAEAKIWHNYYAVRRSMLDDHLKEQEKAAAIEQARNEKLVSVLQKRDADIEAIQKRRDDAEIELQQRTADTVAKIVEQTIEANEAEFRKLQQRQADLLQNAGRSEDEANRKAQFDDLQLQIDDNRKQRDELEAHLQKVRQIQKSFQAQERDAVYDRNFDSLFRLQEQKKDQLSAEDDSYKQQSKSREQALKDEREDLTRQRNFERSERRIALQNALSDARNAYYQQLKIQNDAAQIAIRKAYEQARIDLDLLNKKTTAEIAIRQQGANAELSLVAQTEQVKQQIFIKYLNEAKAMLGEAPVVYQNPNVEGTVGGSLGNTQGGHSNFFPTGGYAQRGRPFVYNDDRPGQMESFGGVRLPGGMGVAIPFRSGSVSPGSSGGDTYNFQMTFTGNNPEAIAAAVDRRFSMRLKSVIKR